MSEIFSISSIVTSLWVLAAAIAWVGNTIAAEFFFVPRPASRFARFLIGLGVGYGAGCLVLNTFYRMTKKFALSWMIFLSLLVTLVLLHIWRQAPRQNGNRDTRKEVAAAKGPHRWMIASILLLGALGAIATVYVWCSTQYFGMGHSDKYAMISKLFLFSPEPVNLSQHYANSLMTAGLHLFSGISLESINWGTQIVLKMGLLCLVYVSVLEWSGKHLAAWLVMASFALASGSFSLQLFDFIDSGGPFLLMTYPDRILGFFVLFLWMHWLLKIHQLRSEGLPDLSTDPNSLFLRFLLTWCPVAAFLAIAVEDLLVLFFIPAFFVAVVLLKDAVAFSKKRNALGKLLGKALLIVGLTLYFIATQGGLLTSPPQVATSREKLNYAVSEGEHQVKVNSGLSFVSKPRMWYRVYSQDRQTVCHSFLSVSGWKVFLTLFYIAGTGLTALLLLYFSKLVTNKNDGLFFSVEHFPLRFTFWSLLVPGVFLSLFFDDGAYGETISRFFQWSLFLSFMFVGYLFYFLWNRTALFKVATVFLFVLSIYPVCDFVTRPFMLGHLQTVIGFYLQAVKQVVSL